jgi:competence protein ComEA
MRSRSSAQNHAAEVARRRLELLSAELAAIRPATVPPPEPLRDGSGEPSSDPFHPVDPLDRLDPLAAVAHERTPGRAVPPRPGRHAARPVPGRAVAGWLEDRLPAALAGRVRISAAHVAAVAVLVALAMVLLAWNAVRAGDPGDLVPARSSTALAPPAPGALTQPPPAGTPADATSPVPTSAGTEAAAAGSGEVVVDVAGKVRRPGIVRLPAGSRVVDAVEAAGGARRGVDLVGLNLARLLVDGEQVLVGVAAVPGVAASAAAAPGTGGPTALVNINTADQATLETLPGIGPVTAASILDWRTENGAFSAVEELMEVSGIGEATLADLAPYVTV